MYWIISSIDAAACEGERTSSRSTVAAMATDVTMSGTSEFDLPPRKKPKVSELPLSSIQRGSIDGLLHVFKKKGEFDGIRKKAFQQYNESAQRGMFEAALRNFTTNEIDREPVKYLKPDQRIAAPLLEGAAARADSYAKTEADYADGSAVGTSSGTMQGSLSPRARMNWNILVD